MQIDITAQFVLMQCGGCGIYFYIPQAFHKECLENKDKGWYCPNGHSRQFSESKVEKLEQRLAEKDKEIERLRTDRFTFKMGLENREKRLVKLRKQVKKLKAGA